MFFEYVEDCPLFFNDLLTRLSKVRQRVDDMIPLSPSSVFLYTRALALFLNMCAVVTSVLYTGFVKGPPNGIQGCLMSAFCLEVESQG